MVELVTNGSPVSVSVMLYGGEPPEMVIPHGEQVSRVPETLAVTVNAGSFSGVVTHCVVCPSEKVRQSAMESEKQVPV